MDEEKALLAHEQSSSATKGAVADGHSHSSKKKSSLRFALALGICLYTLARLLLYGGAHLLLDPGLHGHHDKHMITARHILKKDPLIDGHDDLLILLRAVYGNHINNESFTGPWENGGSPGQLDIPRLEEGQMGGAFWSAWVPCPANGSDFSDANYAGLVKATYEQIDLYNRLSERYPKYFTLPGNAAEAVHAFKHGKLISPLAIEGLHQIGNSISTLRNYHALGVRYATLTWNCHNAYADAALVYNEDGKMVASTPQWHGISPSGRALIHEMNRLGMLVDLSHVSANTMRDVLYGNYDLSQPPSWSGSLAPPIFSHSSAYGICPHPRNVPDDVLRLVAQRKGVVMVNVLPDFISCVDEGDPSGVPRYVPENATLAQVVKHIVYIGELIGYDYVGIGTDFDGMERAPRGFEGVDKFPDLVAGLLRAGVREKDVVKVVGRNILRVWKEADRVSAKMKKDGRMPLEDTVGKIE